jgi:DnaJ-class molecular chaperone
MENLLLINLMKKIQDDIRNVKVEEPKETSACSTCKGQGGLRFASQGWNTMWDLCRDCSGTGIETKKPEPREQFGG